MRILIVDDSRVMRSIVTRTLRQAGFGAHEIIEAADGKQGLDKALAEGPDLVLSDWNMPEMSGLDFLRALRSAGKETPFAFVTSEGSDQMREVAEAAGAMFLIAKPFTAETFATRLGAVLV